MEDEDEADNPGERKLDYKATLQAPSVDEHLAVTFDPVLDIPSLPAPHSS